MNQPTLTKDKATFLFEEIARLSRQIVDGCQQGELNTMNRLLGQRGQIIEQAHALDLNHYSPELKAHLSSLLEECTELESQIMQSLETTKAKMKLQFRALRRGKQLIEQYKLNTLPRSLHQHRA